MIRTLMVSVLFVVSLFTGAAHAQAVALIATGPLVGDGVTPATLRVWVEGAKVTDRVKINPTAGRAGIPQVGADGVVAFSYVPPAITTAQQIAIDINVRGSLKLDRRVDVPVNPAPQGTYVLTAEPSQLVFGRDAAATLRIKPNGSSPVAPEARSIFVNASIGAVSEPTPGGDGTFVVRWTPPATMDSSKVAIIGVTDRAAPGSIVGWTTVPILVEKSVTYDVLAGSQNVLVAGDRTYGPSQATPQGKVSFKVLVDPAQLTGNLQTVRGTERTEKVVEIPLDDYTRVSFLPVAPRVPGAADVGLDLWVVANQKTGAPLINAAASITASQGTVTPAAATSTPGIYKATWTAPVGASGTATFTASVDGQEAKASAELVAPVTSVVISAEPTELPKGVLETTLTARVKDVRGTGLVGQPPLLAITGGTLQGTLLDNQDGTYTAKVKLDKASTGIAVQAEAPVVPSLLLPYRILVWPAQGIVPADGKSKTEVTLVVVDRYGLPIPNVAVTLSVPLGDGSLPPRAITNDRGIARMTYTAGTRAGTGTLRADAGGVWGAAPLFQRGATAPASSSLPGGNPVDLALLNAWSTSMPAVSIGVVGEGPKAGPPASATVNTVPQFTTPGAAIQVTVRLVDAAQLAVKDQKITVTSSVGTVAKVIDNGDGSYTTTVQLPAGTDGPVTVQATAGAATGSVSLPTLASMGTAAAASTLQPQAAPQPQATASPVVAPAPSAAPVTPEAAVSAAPLPPPPAPAADKPAKAGKEPKPTGDDATTSASSSTSGQTPWATASVSVAFVPHAYSMTSGGSANVPTDASFFNRPLTPGFEVKGLAWPGSGSVGLEGRFKGHLDMLTVGEQTLSNFGTNYHVGGRFRSEVSPGTHWFAAVGFHGLSGLVFLYTDENKDELELEQAMLYGGRIGGGLLLDKDAMSLDLGLYETFAPTPIDTALMGTLDVPMTEMLAFRAGLDLQLYTMEVLVRSEEAKITDIELGVNLGVSYSFF